MFRECTYQEIIVFPQISNKISGIALSSFLQKSVFCWNKQAAEGEKEEVNKGMSARKRAVSTEQNRRRRGVREWWNSGELFVS